MQKQKHGEMLQDPKTPVFVCWIHNPTDENTLKSSIFNTSGEIKLALIAI